MCRHRSVHKTLKLTKSQKERCHGGLQQSLCQYHTKVQQQQQKRQLPVPAKPIRSLLPARLCCPAVVTCHPQHSQQPQTLRERHHAAFEAAGAHAAPAQTTQVTWRAHSLNQTLLGLPGNPTWAVSLAKQALTRTHAPMSTHTQSMPWPSQSPEAPQSRLHKSRRASGAQAARTQCTPSRSVR